MPDEKIDNSKLIFAFYSFNMWHIKDALNETTGIYKTAKNREEMFVLLYDMGYELTTCSDKSYFFKLSNNK